jgi:hypothetical protein
LQRLARRTRHARLACAAFLAGACTGAALRAPGTDLTGIYALSAVDGAAIPARASTAECAIVVTDGQLAISRQHGEMLPLYVLHILGRSPCATGAASRAPVEVLRDYGDWHTREGRMILESRAGYASSVSAVSHNAPSMKVTLSVNGRQYGWRRARGIADPVAPLSFLAVDVDRSPVDGVYLEIRDSRGLVTRGVTNAQRAFLTGVSPGEIDVFVTPPNEYRLQRPQQNPIRINASLADSAELTVMLERRLD